MTHKKVIIDSEVYNSQNHSRAVEIFLDASDLFPTPGGFPPPAEARIQKGFVVRLVFGIAPSIFEPGQCYQALPEGCRGNFQNATYLKLP